MLAAMSVRFRHLVSTKDLARADVDVLFGLADEMDDVLKKGGDDRLHGKMLASLFFEPSTRTRLSFETAMLRLGGQVITADGLQFSSLYKGETVEDTMRVVGQYADIIAMRHPEAGSALRAASVSPVPFINAGDGPGEHPTQALLDLLTIQKERGRMDDLHITMVGDLKYGRTVHSLVQLLFLSQSIRFTFVAPDALALPADIIALLDEKGIPYDHTTHLSDGLDADVLYMTRIQKERFADPAQYEELKDAYVLKAEHVRQRDCTILHPLPRVGEIAVDVDVLPQAAYFRQARNGLLLRMALIATLLD